LGNWSLGRVPISPSPAPDGFDDAVVNTVPVDPSKIATITADLVASPRDIKIGIGGGANGQLNHRSGIASTGTGNWTFVGYDGATGVYNLANTTTTGGSLTGFGTGTGNLNVGGLSGTAGRLYVGQGGGNGTMNINTTGTITVRNDIRAGESGGIGVINVDAGTITTGG
jgi:hypothetical protein